jgi:hypothetical protein
MKNQKRASVECMLCLIAILAAGSADEKRPGPAGEALPFLMAEDFEDLDFCAWRVEPGQPDKNNPLVEPAMPWDAGGVLAHGTVLRDPIDGLWKAWQHSIAVPAGKPDKPEVPHVVLQFAVDATGSNVQRPGDRALVCVTPGSTEIG